MRVNEQFRNMPLADAIRKGAAQRPQCFGVLFTDRESCALGAAYEGIFGAPQEIVGETTRAFDQRIHAELQAVFPALLHVHAVPLTCPACTEPQWSAIDYDTLAEVITHLNDQHEWTRERIADWLEPRRWAGVWTTD